MRTLRITGSARLLGVTLALMGTVVLVGCGSSSSTSPTTSTSSMSPASTMAPAIASSIPPIPSPLPSAPSTMPPSVQAPCSALAASLSISDLRLRNSGNWTAERQRIITDAASNVQLFTIATNGVPAEVARALEVLKGYSVWLGDTVADAPSFDAANSAVNAFPDLDATTRATSVVNEWMRANC